MYKPYWNEDLQREWDSKVDKERKWLNCKGGTNQKRRLRALYCEQRRHFERLNRRSKRQFQLLEQQKLAE